MKFGSLFSGIGGFDAGLERAGMECVWQIEIDKDCQRVLVKHFPNVERFEDVTTVGKLPTADVICGGFPCQDLSVAGKRAGLAGERSGLWFEFLRIIGLNRPRWIVIENVPGLLSSDEHRDFAAILRGLVQCGYCLAWRVLDAQFYGVAQRRRRVFIVGSLGDGSSAEILFESESVSWNPPTRGETGPRVAATIRGGASGGSAHGKPNGSDERELISMPLKSKANSSHDESHESYVVGALAAHEKKHGHAMTTQKAAECGQLVTHALSSEGADASEDGTGRGTPIVAAPITSAFAKHHGRTAGNNGGADNLVVNCFNGYTGEPDDNDAQGNHLVRAWALHSQNSCAMTGNGDAEAAIPVDKVRALDGGAGFTASQGGNLLQQSTGPVFGVRRLTPRECERLQGFPDDWTLYDASGKEISDSARYRMLGNAVCVNVAYWLGMRIMEVASK